MSEQLQNTGMSQNEKYLWCFATAAFGVLVAEFASSGQFDIKMVIMNVYWSGATLLVHKLIWSKE